MTPTPPDALDPRERSNLVAGAIVLLLLLVGAVVLVVALRGGFGGRKGSLYSVYLPGPPPVDASAEVLFQGQHVGEVVHVDPPRIGLQLQVTAAIVPELTQVVTLFPGDSIRLAEPSGAQPTVIALPALTEAVIRNAGGTVRLHRDAANGWVVDASGSREPPTLNGTAPDPRQTTYLQTGGQLGFGRVRLAWQDVQELSRLTVRIRLESLRKAADLPDTTGSAFLLGPRSSVTPSTAFGLGNAALRLEPAFGRPAFVLQPDSVIATAPSVDLERTVQGMLNYLNSPAALRREPATRFERLVSDLNRSLEQVAVAGAQVDSLLRRANAVAAMHGGQGMVGRLVLDPRVMDTLQSVANRLAVVATPLADTSRSLLARLKLDTLEAEVKGAMASATGTFRRVDTTVDKVKSVAESLQGLVRAANQIVRDSLPPVVGRANGALSQGAGAAKAAKVALPAALLSGIAVAITGMLKMFGVF
jgi:hypothetical protein